MAASGMHFTIPMFTIIILAACTALAAEQDAPLPDGVKAVWDLGKAAREKTSTRERVCLNGLWRWQPAQDIADAPPAAQWGYFKVPGSWPGVTDYMQKECQTVHAHPAWQGVKMRELTAVWYQREFSVPAEWTGRRIALHVEYINSFAVAYIDGKKVGEIRYPQGEVDLASVCRPGERHTLSLLVVAMPLKGVMLSYNDTASAREVKGTVRRRGLCGDVFLVGEPAGARLGDVAVNTSTRRWEITFDAAIKGLGRGPHALRAEILDGPTTIKTFTSKPLQTGDIKDGRFAFTETWRPEKLWDVHTPRHVYTAQVSLLDADGRALDTALPVRFGFREFWIEGRDFYLNGSRIYLSSVPLDNAQVGAAWASYDAARESLQRLQSFGINFVYTHNYGCEPGSHLSFAEILRAADDAGILVALSQPHFGHYEWDAADADQTNGYASHAEFYVRVAQNHPSVVAYATSHNATGYAEDMNPDLIDGIYDKRDRWSLRNVAKALRAEAIVKRLDPIRVVYHHSSGNLSSMHTSNFYPNFVPMQEMSDWFEHWATNGVKPLFTCEYAAPCTWDWAMYRGWYKGKREFGSARVPWEFCLAEWNAQFLGDTAFQISEAEKKNLRWEAKLFQAGRIWHRWDYPHQLGSRDFDERYPVLAMYLTDNWRAFRTWGMSANSPWEHGIYWKQRNGLDRNRREEFKTDWENLQRPGFSADYLQDRYERMDLAYQRSDWVATPAAEALYRNNMPLLAYIAGKPARFTSKDHNFLPGETVEKQIILINNSRETVECECEWSFGLPEAVAGSRKVRVATGAQERIALRFDLPAALPPGRYELRATVRLAAGDVQKDSFAIHVLPREPGAKPAAQIALFDPKGETAKLLSGMGVACRPVEAGADLSPFNVLVIGKGALAPDAAAPDVARVREGLKVLVFEQTSDALEKRLGFRVQEYGLRQVFPRVAGHPALAGLDGDNLRDWRGEATLLPPRLKYELNTRYNYVPTVKWCGLDVPRVWRCGNLGNVASVLIEKPARGDFMPIADGGFSLQYAPLLEYREGRGMMLFCQMDVTGRTENDPAAERLARNILQYVSAWQPAESRKAVYVGDPAGRRHLDAAGFSPGEFDGGALRPGRVLVVGPGGGRELAPRAEALAAWLKAQGRLLAIGLDEEQAKAFLPFAVRMGKGEHIASYFETFRAGSPLAGVGSADVHNRDPRELPLVLSGRPVGNGVLALAEEAPVVFCQIAPWQLNYENERLNVKRTYRRASFVVTRLLANMGAAASTPLLDRFRNPVDAAGQEKRWLDGLYLDQPEEWDDPYRFFRW